MKLLKKQILPDAYDTPAFLVTLSSPDGFSVTLCSAGAAVRAILCPQPDGSLKNIALSFADDAAYAGNSLYAGAVLAPAAGRISSGILPLPAAQDTGGDGRDAGDGNGGGDGRDTGDGNGGNDGRDAGDGNGGDDIRETSRKRIFHLTRNENGVHTLHGGAGNASFKNWEIAETACSQEEASVTFSLTLPDGLDGFPGNRRLTAAYRLTPGHCLELTLSALSDRETYIDMSSHTYLNLSGIFGRDALDHELQIRSRYVAVNRPDFIPERIVPSKDSPFDFSTPCSLREQMERYPDDPQLKGNCGWNHCFVLEREDGEDPMASPVLLCSCPGSPVLLRAYTDAPCMVLYSGGYIENDLPLLSGFSREDPLTLSRSPDVVRSVPSCGLAFEFQGYADAPGGHGFPYHLTPAGQTWSRRIRWEFRQGG